MEEAFDYHQQGCSNVFMSVTRNDLTEETPYREVLVFGQFIVDNYNCFCSVQYDIGALFWQDSNV